MADPWWLKVVIFYNFLVLIYFFALNTVYLLLLLLAALEIRYQSLKPRMGVARENSTDIVPTVGVFVPAYNEEQTIRSTIKALLNLEYPQLEVIVINDGSTDDTLAKLKQDFKLLPVSRQPATQISTEEVKQVYKSLLKDQLVVIDKANGGKADALNAGLNFTRSELFISVDADTLIEPGGLESLVEEYLTRDAQVVGVGGIVNIANGSKVVEGRVKKARIPSDFIPSMQIIEYLRAVLFGRMGWSRIEALPIISGAFGLFHTESVVETGGYRTDTVGEDMDLVIRLHRLMHEKDNNYSIVFTPKPVCWTQAPETLRSLHKQRSRWQRGLGESLVHNWDMIGKPQFGRIGMLALPFYLVFEFLGPLVEVTGTVVFAVSWALGWVNLDFALLFFLLAVLYGTLLSTATLVMGEWAFRIYDDFFDQLKLLGLALVENFGYRQAHAWWRFSGIIDFIKGKDTWGEMIRSPFEIDS